MRRIYQGICLACFICLNSCQSNSTQENAFNQKKPYASDLLHIAQLSENLYQIKLVSPWDKSVQYIYCTTDSTELDEIQDTISTGNFGLQIPVQNLISSSVTHIGFLDALNSIPVIQAHAQVEYIHNPQVLNRIESGEIIPLESFEGSQIEEVIQLEPDLVLVSSFANTSEALQRIQNLGIPVLPIAEWKETHPLSRLHWLELFAVLTNQYERAKGIIQEVTDEYLQLAKTALPTNTQILSGYDYKGIWYSPGGNSFLGNLFNEAGFEYYYSNTLATGSVSNSIEEVLIYQSKADVWLFPGSYQSLQDILSDQPLMREVKAVQQNQVYQVNVKLNDSKLVKVDYWEKGVVHPEWILSDMIQIAQGRTNSLYFFTKLPME